MKNDREVRKTGIKMTFEMLKNKHDKTNEKRKDVKRHQLPPPTLNNQLSKKRTLLKAR